MTDWKEYPALDWKKIRRLMRSPALVYDTRNCLDLQKLAKLGFKVLAVGR
jgi:UDPglucose 6-dehydrogenase